MRHMEQLVLESMQYLVVVPTDDHSPALVPNKTLQRKRSRDEAGFLSPCIVPTRSIRRPAVDPLEASPSAAYDSDEEELIQIEETFMCNVPQYIDKHRRSVDPLAKKLHNE